jgi:hypothetical protein
VVFASTVPKLCQILSLDHPCARIQWHFIGLAVHLLQGFSFHLQFHLRILFEDFGIALPEELGNPFVGDTACTESSCVSGAQVVDPEVRNSCAFQRFPPCGLEILLVTGRIVVAREHEWPDTRDPDLALEGFDRQRGQGNFSDTVRSLGIGAPVTVAPALNSVSPARGPTGSSVSVTLNGNGFGSSPTVNVGSGITVTVNSCTNTQIQASFAISASAAGGNRAASVTAGGQTSLTVNFYVQIPASLSIARGDKTTPEASCTFVSGGTTYTGCGLTRSFTYQVNDQAGSPIQAEGLPVWDSFGTVSPNPLNIAGFNTTCTPANTGPCGLTTDVNGQFNEKALSVCAVACRSNGVCVSGGPSVVCQTWHVGSGAITQTISYYCQKVLVNGK